MKKRSKGDTKLTNLLQCFQVSGMIMVCMFSLELSREPRCRKGCYNVL